MSSKKEQFEDGLAELCKKYGVSSYTIVYNDELKGQYSFADVKAVDMTDTYFALGVLQRRMQTASISETDKRNTTDEV